MKVLEALGGNCDVMGAGWRGVASSAETLATPPALQTERSIVPGSFGPVGKSKDSLQQQENSINS